MCQNMLRHKLQSTFIQKKIHYVLLFSIAP